MTPQSMFAITVEIYETSHISVAHWCSNNNFAMILPYQLRQFLPQKWLLQNATEKPFEIKITSLEVSFKEYVQIKKEDMLLVL